MKFCPNCGSQLTEDAKFCVNCGTPIGQEAPAEQAPVYQQAVSAPAEKPRKKGGKKVVWIVLAIVLVLVLALAAVVGVMFFGNSTGVDEAVLGTYKIVEGDYGDTAEDAEDDYIELLEKGKAAVCLLGDEAEGKWKLEEDALTLKVNKEELTGTLADGIIVLEYEDVAYTYVHKDRMKSYLEQKEQEAKEALIEATAGYWLLQKTESDDPDKVLDEEMIEVVRDTGVQMYMVLSKDGTGSLVMGEEISLTWGDGVVNAEDEAWPYVLEGDNLILENEDGDIRIWFIRGEGEAPEIVEEPEDPFGEPITYVTVAHVNNGIEYNIMQSAASGDTYIEFYGDGTGYIVDGEGNYSGDEYVYCSEITYDSDTIYVGDYEYSYYLDGEQLHFFVETAESSLEYICVPKDTLSIDSVKTDFWDGDWYGWYVIKNATGEYADWVADWDDVYAQFFMTMHGTGYLRVWDTTTAKNDLMMEVGLSLGEGTTQYGAVVCEEGYIWDDSFESGEWTIDVGDSAVSQYENMICLKLHYVDPADSQSTIDYEFYLRPWGMKWEDMREVHDPWEYMTPCYYDEWYLPLLEKGIDTMPDSYAAGQEILGITE